MLKSLKDIIIKKCLLIGISIPILVLLRFTD